MVRKISKKIARRIKRTLFLAALVFVLSVIFCETSFGAEKVTRVNLTVNETKEDPGIIYEADVVCSSSSYEITDVTVSKDYDSWTPAKKVTFTVTVEPAEGYSFSKSDTKISVSNGELASSAVKSGSITAKINYYPKVLLEEPCNIYWDDEYVAVWDKAEYATAYEVKIYKDGSSYKTVTVTKPSIDLSDYATDDCEVTFSVRAIAKDSTDAKYIKSSDWADCDDGVYSSDNTVYGTFSGDYGSYRFKDEYGTYVSGWQLINGNWYYFDPDNDNRAVCSAWRYVDGRWYHFDSSCVMETGWIRENGKYYFLSYSSGAMKTGWYCAGPEGPWYYLDPVTGEMWASSFTPDGYWVNADGTWNG